MKIIMDNEATEHDYLVCYRLSDLPNPPVAAIITACEACEAEVWVALSSPIKPIRICVQCALSLKAEETAITEKQIEDIRRNRKS
jgi:hypothetical protein